MFHLVDDSFLVAQTFYLLESSSVTRFLFFLIVDWGHLFLKKNPSRSAVSHQHGLIPRNGKAMPKNLALPHFHD
jgi:hypothetical protein